MSEHSLIFIASEVAALLMVYMISGSYNAFTSFVYESGSKRQTVQSSVSWVKGFCQNSVGYLLSEFYLSKLLLFSFICDFCRLV